MGSPYGQVKRAEVNQLSSSGICFNNVNIISVVFINIIHKTPSPVQSSINWTIFGCRESQNTDANANNGNLIHIKLSIKAKAGRGLNMLETNKVTQKANIALTQNDFSQDQSRMNVDRTRNAKPMLVTQISAGLRSTRKKRGPSNHKK